MRISWQLDVVQRLAGMAAWRVLGPIVQGDDEAQSEAVSGREAMSDESTADSNQERT